VVEIGKAKLVHRKNMVKLSWPAWKVILKLRMTLISYGTWSVLCSPVGRVKPSERGRDDVGRTLYDVGELCGNIWRGDSLFTIIITMMEKRSRSENTRIANTEIPKVINPEFVLIPVKGWKTDFSVDLEELIDMFPCF
jgi:hypothetical protein